MSCVRLPLPSPTAGDSQEPRALVGYSRAAPRTHRCDALDAADTVETMKALGILHKLFHKRWILEDMCAVVRPPVPNAPVGALTVEGFHRHIRCPHAIADSHPTCAFTTTAPLRRCDLPLLSRWVSLAV